MSSIVAYSQVVRALLPRDSWDEAYFSLLSLKSHLQSLPGWQRFDMWARTTESDGVRLIVVTNWDFSESLATWLEKGVTVDSILRSIEPAPQELDVDVYEEIA